MANSVLFNGLEHYPIGDATLEIVNGRLVVSNIGGSGMDGVSVRVAGSTAWEAVMEPIQLSAGQSIYMSQIGRDSYGRMKTVGERAVFVDPQSGLPSFAFNSKLLEPSVELLGTVAGDVVFQRQYTNPENDPEVNWWIVAVAVGMYVLDHVNYEHTTTTDENGCTTTTEKFCWNGSIASGGGGGSDDPITTFDGQEVLADHLYLNSSKAYEEGIPAGLDLDIQEVRITGRNIPQLVFTEELYG